MLDKDTRTVLGQLGAINNSMIISYPKTSVIMGKSIQAYLDLEKLGEEPFEEIGLYNFGEFNSIVNLIDDATIEREDNGVLNITNSNSSIRYGTTSIGIIESSCRGNPELLDRIKGNTKVAEFELDVKDLDKIKKMSSVLKDLLNLEIYTEDGMVNLKVTSKEKSSNNFVINLPGNVSEDFDMVISIDIINKLPGSSFKVGIYKSAKGTLIAILESTTVDGLEIILAAKANA